MKKAKVIIGGGFGDEGKGLFTDYLAARDGTMGGGKGCVVRFNGGAQAGHTVQLKNGRRHVFSHFGSGSFAGYDTYLSSFFACNPIIFLREYGNLGKVQCRPRVMADPACPVTTPYDIMINQIVEASRGDKRHGSVGVGFGETLERHESIVHALYMRDLIEPDKLRTRLDAIRTAWVPQRLARLGVTQIPGEWQARLNDDSILDHFLKDCARFIGLVSLVPLLALSGYDNVIFEGAQGLLLDQNYGWFPHVTRSNTGVRNAITLAEKAGFDALDVYYLTRTYLTRHGAGPLPYELPRQPYEKISDPTNRPNPYQGALRFAYFDLDMFCDMTGRDLTSQTTRLQLNPHVAMSCLDQVDNRAFYRSGGKLQSCSPEELLEKTRRAIGGQSALAGYGPTRATVREILPKAARSVLAWPHSVLEPFDIAQRNAFAGIF